VEKRKGNKTENKFGYFTCVFVAHFQDSLKVKKSFNLSKFTSNSDGKKYFNAS
jgi:hypothetical protein